MDIDAELTKIFAEDDLGLFDIKPKRSSAKTADQRLIDSFEEINDFVAENGLEPKSDGGVIEKRLAFRLHGIRSNPKKFPHCLNMIDSACLRIFPSKSIILWKMYLQTVIIRLYLMTTMMQKIFSL